MRSRRNFDDVPCMIHAEQLEDQYPDRVPLDAKIARVLAGLILLVCIMYALVQML